LLRSDRVRAILVLAIAACSSSGPSRARLADLHATTLTVTYPLGIWINTTGDGCPSLDRDAIANIGGVQLPLTDAVLGDDGSCQPETVVVTDALTSVTSPIELTIADPSATWTVDFALSSRFTLSPEPLAQVGTSIVTWVDGPPLTSACVWVDGVNTRTLGGQCNGYDLGATQPVQLRADPPNSFQFTFGPYGEGGLDAPSPAVAVEVWVSGTQQIEGGTKGCRGPTWCQLEEQGTATVQ
jgi:hypothetical protein